jgi:maleate isomerase
MTDEGRSPVRVGLLIPSSNTVMEVDFYRRLPSHVTLHTGRMYMESTTPEGEGVMLDEHALPAARDVGTANPHVVVFGCTSAGALRGNDYDLDLCRRIADQTEAEVVSVIVSVRAAIRARAAARVGVVTPYVDALNEKIRESLEADGLEVPVIRGLGITENFDIARVPPEEIVAFAIESLREAPVDLVFASCTNFRAMEAIGMIEERLQAPLVTSNQAALEATLLAVEKLEDRARSPRMGAV